MSRVNGGGGQRGWGAKALMGLLVALATMLVIYVVLFSGCLDPLATGGAP